MKYLQKTMQQGTIITTIIITTGITYLGGSTSIVE